MEAATQTAIKANELRIGNWVLDDFSDDQPKPYRIEGDDISRAAVNGVPYSPIPLTPEILEKCGFEIRTLGDGITPIYSASLLTTKEFIINQIIGNWCYSPSKSFSTPLLYVHQLQNLYFALTAEELQINL